MADASFAHGELTGKILEAFQTAHRELGSGFSEAVSRAALVVVLQDMGLDVAVDVPIHVQFRGKIIGRFFADVIVNGTVMVEVKAGTPLEGWPVAQLLNYLRAGGGGVGLLLNFGKRPEHKRLIMGDNPANSLPLLRHVSRIPEPDA